MRKIIPEIIKKNVLILKNKNYSIDSILKKLQISKATYYRILKNNKKDNDLQDNELQNEILDNKLQNDLQDNELENKLQDNNLQNDLKDNELQNELRDNKLQNNLQDNDDLQNVIEKKNKTFNYNNLIKLEIIKLLKNLNKKLEN
uniref:Uncharacterized protein n=1 Tax=viral metagenome TaxID=1070528 RepID=A0A6C0EEQ4_9ZZZZ